MNIVLKRNYSIINQMVRNYSTPRRALMYVPGDDKRKLNKAFNLDVDCIAMDCEDGVALNRKSIARETIRDILNDGKPTSNNRNYDWAVRVNSVDSDFCADDLAAVLTSRNLPDTILLPKVDHIDHLKAFAKESGSYVTENKSVNLIIYIESAVAIINLPDICKASIELSEKGKFLPVALVFGSDDFLASIGASRTDDSLEVLYARQKLVLVAKAFGLQAIDMVYIQYKDLKGLRKQSEDGARMGYTGKQIIHPDQIPVVQETFLPNAKQAEWANGLLQAFEKHQKTGKGAFAYSGSMIDMPTMKQAQNIIDLIQSVKEYK